VFAEYFKEVEEESIRDNFVIVYELLDEVMDYGSPQFTDSKVIIYIYILDCTRLIIISDITRIYNTRRS